QLTSAASDQHDVTSRRRLHRGLGQATHVSLVRWMQAPAVEQAQLVLVQTLQLGVGHVFDGGGLVQQLAVEQFPAEGRRQAPRQLSATGAIRARHRDDVHTLLQRVSPPHRKPFLPRILRLEEPLAYRFAEKKLSKGRSLWTKWKEANPHVHTPPRPLETK